MSFKQPTKTEIFMQKNFPLMFSLLVIVISFAPIHIPDLFFIKPQILLIIIYCWAVNYCDDFSYGSVILCGVLEDFMDASLFGINTLCYVLFFHLIVTNRKYIAWKNFSFSWAGFMLLSLMALILKWIFVSLSSSAIIGFGPVFFSWVVVGLLFPSIFITTYNLYNRVLGVRK